MLTELDVFKAKVRRVAWKPISGKELRLRLGLTEATQERAVLWNCALEQVHVVDWDAEGYPIYQANTDRIFVIKGGL